MPQFSEGREVFIPVGDYWYCVEIDALALNGDEWLYGFRFGNEMTWFPEVRLEQLVSDFSKFEVAG